MPGWQDDPDLRAAVEGELALLTPAVLRSVILVTCTSVRSSGSRACRSSIWVREGDRWLLRHHQGTPLSQQGR